MNYCHVSHWTLKSDWEYDFWRTLLIRLPVEHAVNFKDVAVAVIALKLVAGAIEAKYELLPLSPWAIRRIGVRVDDGAVRRLTVGGVAHGSSDKAAAAPPTQLDASRVTRTWSRSYIACSWEVVVRGKREELLQTSGQKMGGSSKALHVEGDGGSLLGASLVVISWSSPLPGFGPHRS